MDEDQHETAPQPAASQQPATIEGFDFNRPTIISLLYLVGCVVGVTPLIGVILGYVWKGEPHAAWEDSHYQYLIRTFWIALIGVVVSIPLMLVLIGIFVLIGVGVLVVVRSVMSLLAAQKHQPMPNPESWLI